MQEALLFALDAHQFHQQQKRKGKDVPYIVHPLAVGLLLAHAGAKEETIVAGILHDTIEDSTPEHKVTKQILSERFGPEVARLVASVSETDKTLPWAERKRRALEDIARFDEESVLVKSADVICNAEELLSDYARDGDEVFSRFNAGKEKYLVSQMRVIRALVVRWPDNPLSERLTFILRRLAFMGDDSYRKAAFPTLAIPSAEYTPQMAMVCPVCGWSGTVKGDKEAGSS